MTDQSTKLIEDVAAAASYSTAAEWTKDDKHRVYFNDSKGRAFGWVDMKSMTYTHVTGSKFFSKVRKVFAAHNITIN